MRLTRRRIIALGGGVTAALSFGSLAARGADVIEIEMAGRGDGSRVWFDPVGIHISPGQTIRWINRDLGNSHTATAYHPDISGRPRRIPERAAPWDSGYLLPDQSFALTLEESGVYDYYCVPHEMAGMVGRIVVGEPAHADWAVASGADEGVPPLPLESFPPVETILKRGMVRGSH